MLLILLFNGAVYAKCGLWYQFSHTKEREGPYFQDAYSHFATAWAFGFGYESLDMHTACNDEEMFQQCNRAQYLFDLYNAAHGLPLTTLGCADHIVCAAQMPANGQYYCQNMDSYDLCVTAQTAMNTTIYSVACNYAVTNTDGRQVLNYRQAPEITTTTTVATTTPMPTTTVYDPNTTTAAITTAPASSCAIVVCWILLMLLLI